MSMCVYVSDSPINSNTTKDIAIYQFNFQIKYKIKVFIQHRSFRSRPYLSDDTYNIIQFDKSSGTVEPKSMKMFDLTNSFVNM